MSASPSQFQAQAQAQPSSALTLKTYQFLQLSESNAILTIALNRPNKKNALSFAMMHELLALANALKKERRIRAVILKGNGDMFCSGIDLNDLGNPNNRNMALWELVKPTQSLFQRVCLIWRELPVPVIAAMHGYCIGAGLQLALAADIRIATPDCQLAIMEAKWGLVPDMGLTQSALHVVRADVLKELAMSARLLDANEAQRLGLISHIDADMVGRAQALAETFATRSPDAVLASKRLINTMTQQRRHVLYREKLWQIKLLLGRNRKLALKKAKDSSVTFLQRQFH